LIGIHMITREFILISRSITLYVFQTASSRLNRRRLEAKTIICVI
jgi:hypothetical protein